MAAPLIWLSALDPQAPVLSHPEDRLQATWAYGTTPVTLSTSVGTLLHALRPCVRQGQSHEVKVCLALLLSGRCPQRGLQELVVLALEEVGLASPGLPGLAQRLVERAHTQPHNIVQLLQCHWTLGEQLTRSPKSHILPLLMTLNTGSTLPAEQAVRELRTCIYICREHERLGLEAPDLQQAARALATAIHSTPPPHVALWACFFPGAVTKALRWLYLHFSPPPASILYMALCVTCLHQEDTEASGPPWTPPSWPALRDELYRLFHRRPTWNPPTPLGPIPHQQHWQAPTETRLKWDLQNRS